MISAGAEQLIRAHHAEGNLHGAATALLEAYGAELLGYLRSLVASEHCADVFSTFCEHLWRGLPTVQFESSARTWSYVVARNAALMFLRSPAQFVALSQAGAPSQLPQQLRSATMSFLAPEKLSRLAEVRASLAEEDQTLLVLRVDRGMSWSDIAQVLSSETPLTRAEATRRSAALRKRFERLTAALRERLRPLPEARSG